MDVITDSSNKSALENSGIRYQMLKHASIKAHEVFTQLANLYFKAQTVPSQ